MELSLATNATGNDEEQEKPTNRSTSIEKEHMFDKVVTPSDVGKLNRLVIPKQHAEKYFPLDSSSSEKGLLLNFEDRNGKPWRFRYSYWNSSQSYVMTKGWSRFVKEKKLDAGDIVSFHRGVGELGKDRLFIDWRRRSNVIPDPTSIIHFNGTSPRFYSFPFVPRNYEQFHQLNHGYYTCNNNQYLYHQQLQEGVILGYGYGGTMGKYYSRSLEQNLSAAAEPLVIESVPVAQPRAQPPAAVASKRLRLFGVNMECSNTTNDTEDESSSMGSMPRVTVGSSSSSLQLRLHPSSEESSTVSMQAADDQYSKKGKSCLPFDLDQ